MSSWIDRAIATRAVDADGVPTNGNFRTWKFIGASLTPSGDQLIIEILGGSLLTGPGGFVDVSDTSVVVDSQNTLLVSTESGVEIAGGNVELVGEGVWFIGAAAPTAPTHLANKAYVDSVAGGGASITDGTATLSLASGSLSETGLVNVTLTPSGTWSVTAGGAMTLGAASLSLFPGTNSAVTSWAAEDANTSDDTPTQIGSTWTIADDSAYVVDAQVVAATDGAEIVRVHNVRRVVKATGSTITDGTQTDTSGPESLGGTLATAVSITRTGATGRVDFTGVAGTDIRWRADVTIARLTMPPAPPFVMADIEWEGWIDGPGYSAGTFTGKASAGGSGSRNFDALGTPSTSTENGLATVLLDGTDDYIRYIGGSESADLIAPAGYTYFSVCRIDASSTNSADPFSNPSLGGTGDANAATGVDSAGNIEAYQYQGGNKIAATTWTTTVLVCVFTRYDGTNISVRKGKGAWTNTASSATAATASTWRWGTDYTTTARLTGEFCEHGVTKQVLSDAECDDIADAMAARWGVSV